MLVDRLVSPVSSVTLKLIRYESEGRLSGNARLPPAVSCEDKSIDKTALALLKAAPLFVFAALPTRLVLPVV
jgi:hypothetical protein